MPTPATTHDIYDPPPAPIPWAPPAPEPLRWTAGDLAVLAAIAAAIALGAALAYRVEPTVAGLVLLGGTLVLAESGFTALSFLHSRPVEWGGRWKIFLAALVPWIVGVGLAALGMIGLFRLTD